MILYKCDNCGKVKKGNRIYPYGQGTLLPYGWQMLNLHLKITRHACSIPCAKKIDNESYTAWLWRDIDGDKPAMDENRFIKSIREKRLKNLIRRANERKRYGK